MENKYFEVITGDETLIQEVIEYYNELYKTDFIINEFEDRDGVIFAKISYTKGNINDAVQLGIFLE
ncbi:MAG: hypothetical protein Q4C98_11325 [Capnocytophaga sp.]|nr:hypothetical protein [Capnocytophaga sp.]